MPLHVISWWDLDFDRVPVDFRSTSGVPQTKWLKVGMPRIPQAVVNVVFYLYASVEEARRGEKPGGTGFIVLFDGTFTEDAPTRAFYGVTNWHVACAGGYSVIRLNTIDGGTDIIDLGPDQWFFIPGMHDVAVVPLNIGAVHQVSSISTQSIGFASAEMNTGPHIGIGEDVFMVGLFIDHDGKTTNIPSVRFGNVSMLPSSKATIKQPTGYQGESYVLDLHSRTGFSGSPVFAYRTFGSDLANFWGEKFEEIELVDRNANFGLSTNYVGSNNSKRYSGRLRFQNMFVFLGIHWGQFPERWELKNRGIQESRRDLIFDGAYVEGMSGMTCVIPASCILEVMNIPKLKELRHPAFQRDSDEPVTPSPEPSDGD